MRAHSFRVGVTPELYLVLGLAARLQQLEQLARDLRRGCVLAHLLVLQLRQAGRSTSQVEEPHLASVQGTQERFAAHRRQPMCSQSAAVHHAPHFVDVTSHHS